jgi:hypothetical protein
MHKAAYRMAAAGRHVQGCLHHGTDAERHVGLEDCMRNKVHIGFQVQERSPP